MVLRPSFYAASGGAVSAIALRWCGFCTNEDHAIVRRASAGGAHRACTRVEASRQPLRSKCHVDLHINHGCDAAHQNRCAAASLGRP